LLERLIRVKGKYLKGKTVTFDGSQLTPLWACANADIVGDAIISFRGPLDVPPERMPDVENRGRGKSLVAQDMVHFVVEYFGCDLECSMLIRRLLVSVAADALRDETLEDVDIEREYDDIYAYMPDEEDRRRLSVSSATVSRVSGLVHLGMNTTVSGGPTGAAGLDEMGIEDMDAFAIEVLRRFIDEVKELKASAGKTMPV
jgi:hypothetical protein